MKIGYVLTGGSLKGICAEIGAIAALEDAGIYPSAIIGTSAGAIVGSMYAAGMTPDDMFEAIGMKIKKSDYIDPDWFSLIRLLFAGRGWTGLLKGKKLEHWLENHLPKTRFEDCRFPLHIAVTNVSKGRPEILSTGGLATAARASSSIPFVYKLQYREGQYYTDGGAVNNIALDELVKLHPEIDKFVIISSLRIIKPEEPVDNSFLREFWTPFKMLESILEAIKYELHASNLNAQNKETFIMKIPMQSIGLSEIDKAKKRMNEAFHEATRILKTEEAANFFGYEYVEETEEEPDDDEKGKK